MNALEITNLSAMSSSDKKKLSQSVCQFLDVAVTSGGRSSFYNTKEAQEQAENAAHDNLLNQDRGLYEACLCLPTQERARQIGVVKILSGQGSVNSIIKVRDEARVISHLCSSINPARLVKTFNSLRDKKVNNSRSRRMALSSILSEKKLDWWSVKYRNKIKSILMHAWGVRFSSIIVSILQKNKRNAKESGILESYINQYAKNNPFLKLNEIYECVLFVFGAEREYTLPLFRAFFGARRNLSAGTILPQEVLEGIRSHYHKGTKKDEVLELTKDSLTVRQKIQKQAQAKEAGVTISVDLKNYSAKDLYIFAFQNGMTDEIQKVLKEKAIEASKLYEGWDSVGILVDASGSSFGSDAQKLKPIAVAQSIRDALVESAVKKHSLRYAGGTLKDGLVYPSGETDLATPLAELMQDEPDIIFVLSDGYENSPAGRFHEVLAKARELGITTPVVQLNPVASADSITSGVRRLSSEAMLAPANDAPSIGFAYLRQLLESDPDKGLGLLVNKTNKLLK
jgi:hypothetical protein